MRIQYWSNSKFSKWVRKTFADFEKPSALTFEGWDIWEANNKAKHPFVFWFTEDFLDDVQNFIYWPYDKWLSFKYYLSNGFVSKTHVLSTGLKFGQYYEIDYRIIRGLFETLVDFIEIEKAHMYSWNHPEFKSINKWYQPWRCPESGLAHLAWEMTLDKPQKDEDGKELPYSENPRQAESAREQLALYNWWKHTRPARPDPYEASGFNKENNYDTKNHELLQKIEKQYDDEDEEMMIRLIKIRHHLWT
jgi:hypothetical protein